MWGPLYGPVYGTVQRNSSVRPVVPERRVARPGASGPLGSTYGCPGRRRPPGEEKAAPLCIGLRLSYFCVERGRTLLRHDREVPRENRTATTRRSLRAKGKRAVRWGDTGLKVIPFLWNRVDMGCAAFGPRDDERYADGGRVSSASKAVPGNNLQGSRAGHPWRRNSVRTQRGCGKVAELGAGPEWSGRFRRSRRRIHDNE